jgi:biopolymer transport protein ExbB/TolQ
MDSFHWTIIVTSIIEVLLLLLVLFFFLRLKRSEALLDQLQKNQKDFLEKLKFNTTLEQEMVQNFEERQKELLNLEKKLKTRSQELHKLLEMADSFVKSPQFVRQTIIKGYRQGRKISELADSSGLSRDEIELIIENEQNRGN